MSVLCQLEYSMKKEKNAYTSNRFKAVWFFDCEICYFFYTGNFRMGKSMYLNNFERKKSWRRKTNKYFERGKIHWQDQEEVKTRRLNMIFAEVKDKRHNNIWWTEK